MARGLTNTFLQNDGDPCIILNSDVSSSDEEVLFDYGNPHRNLLIEKSVGLAGSVA